MKASLKKIMKSPWFWIPAVFIVYCILFFGSDAYFDWSGKQWRASLTNSERVELEETWKGLATIHNDGAPWPTFVEFKDGKVGLVYTGHRRENAFLVLVEGKTEFIILGNLKEMFRVHRIAYPGDPNHEDAKQKFFR